MGNRHGSDKPARDEQKEEKRKKKREKEKKTKKSRSKKGKGQGSDVDIDPELSSHVSRADSESVVFHSAENLSPYLDASTRSEDFGSSDNGHVLSSRDFQDGFSLEACLPADLTAMTSSDVSSDLAKHGDDSSTASGGGAVFHTPLLSSAEVRRGIPRSPMAQRQQKDSFLEPVPPIPSDFSSNTLSSVSNYQDNVSSHSSGGRSSRTSSSTVDTNAAHCIERLEELERNIERTIIEKFAPIDPTHAIRHLDSDEDEDDMYDDDNVSPLLRRKRHDFGSREGSATPKGVGPGGVPCRSLENSPAAVRKISEPCRPTYREGSATPKGVVQGKLSQSAENSPVIVRKALPDSPVIVRRTPSQSPSVQRKFPVNAPESPSLLRPRQLPESPGSPSMQRRAQASPGGGDKGGGPVIVRRPVPEVPESQVPPPVPPKSMTLDMVRRVQNVPKSPIMPRKVYAFQQEQKHGHPKQQQQPQLQLFAKQTDRPALGGGDRGDHDDDHDTRGRSRADQMPPRSPSRSPEVRHRGVGRKTPSSSPSPKSLGRKLVPLEDRAPPREPLRPASPPTAIQFCESQKGTPVKRCIVSTHPSTAVVLASPRTSSGSPSSEDSVVPASSSRAEPSHRKEVKVHKGLAESQPQKTQKPQPQPKNTQKPQPKDPPQTPPVQRLDSKKPQPEKAQPKEAQKQSSAKAAGDRSVAKAQQVSEAQSKSPKDIRTTKPYDKSSEGAVSEDEIKHNTESGVFGSVSPKLKRHKKVLADSSSSTQTSTPQTKIGSQSPKINSSKVDSQGAYCSGSPKSPPCSPLSQRTKPQVVTDAQGATAASPGTKRAMFAQQKSRSGNSKDDGTLSADIAGGLTFHPNMPEVEGGIEGGETVEETEQERKLQQQAPVYAKVQKSPVQTEPLVPLKSPKPLAQRQIVEGSTVYEESGEGEGEGRGGEVRGGGGGGERKGKATHVAPTKVQLVPAKTHQRDSSKHGGAYVIDSTVTKNAHEKGRVPFSSPPPDNKVHRFTERQHRGVQEEEEEYEGEYKGEGYEGEEREYGEREYEEEDRETYDGSFERVPNTSPSSSHPASSEETVNTSGAGRNITKAQAAAAAKPITLGHRIREVINERSYKETFTAELSSSSLERDDVTSHTSDDDSVFAHSSGQEWSKTPPRQRDHGHFLYYQTRDELYEDRSQRRESDELSTHTVTHQEQGFDRESFDTTPPSSPPQVKRGKPGSKPAIAKKPEPPRTPGRQRTAEQQRALDKHRALERQRAVVGKHDSQEKQRLGVQKQRSLDKPAVPRKPIGYLGRSASYDVRAYDSRRSDSDRQSGGGDFGSFDTAAIRRIDIDVSVPLPQTTTPPSEHQEAIIYAVAYPAAHAGSKSTVQTSHCVHVTPTSKFNQSATSGRGPENMDTALDLDSESAHTVPVANATVPSVVHGKLEHVQKCDESRKQSGGGSSGGGGGVGGRQETNKNSETHGDRVVDVKYKDQSAVYAQQDSDEEARSLKDREEEKQLSVEEQRAVNERTRQQHGGMDGTRQTAALTSLDKEVENSDREKGQNSSHPAPTSSSPHIPSDTISISETAVQSKVGQKSSSDVKPANGDSRVEASTTGTGIVKSSPPHTTTPPSKSTTSTSSSTTAATVTTTTAIEGAKAVAKTETCAKKQTVNESQKSLTDSPPQKVTATSEMREISSPLQGVSSPQDVTSSQQDTSSSPQDVSSSSQDPEIVPPPSPTAMDMLAEEDEEELEDEEHGLHRGLDCISSQISQEMQLFGENVVRRLSSLLESHASESDSCLEDGGSRLRKLQTKTGKSKNRRGGEDGDDGEEGGSRNEREGDLPLTYSDEDDVIGDYDEDDDKIGDYDEDGGIGEKEVPPCVVAQPAKRHPLALTRSPHYSPEVRRRRRQRGEEDDEEEDEEEEDIEFVDSRASERHRQHEDEEKEEEEDLEFARDSRVAERTRGQHEEDEEEEDADFARDSRAAEGHHQHEDDFEPVMDEELNTFSSADLPGERLVTSDTTETLSTDHETTSASSKRESTTSTATDETLTMTRSTTDSTEFEENFVLPASLVFVRSGNDGGRGRGGRGGGGVRGIRGGGSGVDKSGGGEGPNSTVVESGGIVKRPAIPPDLSSSTKPSSSSATTLPSRSAAAAAASSGGDSPPPHAQPRKKRRRHHVVGSYDVSPSKPSDVTGDYDEEGQIISDDISDDSDLSSSTDDVIREGVYHPITFSRSESQSAKPTVTMTSADSRSRGRKHRPPADRSTDSSDNSEDDLPRKRRVSSLSSSSSSPSSSQDESSFRIPEIEETFGELMGVKTFLEDMEDKTPTSEPLPVIVGGGGGGLAAGGGGGGAAAAAEHHHLKSWHYRRRSKTSPAQTDRTESDLDASERLDDACSTDSMYADDEDEGAEQVVSYQRSYSQEYKGEGGEVLLSCTIYNSSTASKEKEQGGRRDSDEEFWADPEVAAAEEKYRELEHAADAAGSAFQNARIQMHDIHQHLQDLRRQMELLQDDITSTSLTLTPEYSLESEHRPVTE